MYQAKSLKLLIQSITKPTTATSSGGAITESRSIASKHVGNVLWEVRYSFHNGSRIAEAILCWEIEGDNASGWTATRFCERHDLRYVTCPLEYLEMVRPWSAVWRERVWQWHEAELTRQTEGRNHVA